MLRPIATFSESNGGVITVELMQDSPLSARQVLSQSLDLPLRQNPSHPNHRRTVFGRVHLLEPPQGNPKIFSRLAGQTGHIPETLCFVAVATGAAHSKQFLASVSLGRVAAGAGVRRLLAVINRNIDSLLQ